MGNTVYEQLDELEARDTNVNFEPHHASIQNFVGSLKQCLGTSALRFEIGFDYLGLRLKSGKTILQGVSGKVEPGSMLAVMGPSGAGKSTFVRLFMGKLKNTSGTTYVNGDARGQGERYVKPGWRKSQMTIPSLINRWNLHRNRLAAAAPGVRIFGEETSCVSVTTRRENGPLMAVIYAVDHWDVLSSAGIHGFAKAKTLESWEIGIAP
ncbi:hypothetical protein SS1G_06554 [Sclerotinia sclerotiorum 1980 UF-70]|uniref:ABC transporter domain-containing protein n=1 Tax=Sclerotinia sclerotiorum (strain ATCC 18683 / 1980 / Ss-1) TaxID=665079 RepID=A7EMK6_SCLS1|nr:hypothetical protein SS1G_06554 [Sclerotinia sclerotiorum 1980 UF-70]EDO04072.1 hypothetical protein SS1G_06554 [Sclerotinia sclerotiorum 1980 UF-70]